MALRQMAFLAEACDPETGKHIRRTQYYVHALAVQLRENPIFVEWLSAEYVDDLFASAPLHDIGKLKISNDILLKPGKLTVAEFEVMKTHTTLGKNLILCVEQQLNLPFDTFRTAKEIAHSHQEKWNGSGYPQGLHGTQIPLSARIMAVADVYDALTSPRVYKRGFSHDEALNIIRAARGQHFDPHMVDAFLVIEKEFAAVAERYADKSNPDRDIN